MPLYDKSRRILDLISVVLSLVSVGSGHLGYHLTGNDEDYVFLASFVTTGLA